MSTSPLLPHVERILDAARIAPSWGNTQPWRFHVEGETISFLVDQEREPRYFVGMAHIAVGAALECALLRAARMGVTVRIEMPADHQPLLKLTVSDAKRTVEPDKALMRRATNRRLYDGRAIDDATYGWLVEATPPLDGVRTHWFGRERVRVMGPLLEQAETLFYANPRLREVALQSIRFDVRDREEVTNGLAVGSLELSAGDRITLDQLRHTSAERLAATGAAQKMGARARRLVESASGVCIFTRPDGSRPVLDVAVGRAMLRAWLALTRKGFVAHPMSAVQVLDNVLGIEGSAMPDRERVEAAVSGVRSAFPSVEKGASIAMLMRYGFAPPPTTLARRLPVEESVAGDVKPGA
ncbi:MAG TPA: nitroreductase family protein [Polyangiaceae bacterium]